MNIPVVIFLLLVVLGAIVFSAGMTLRQQSLTTSEHLPLHLRRRRAELQKSPPWRDVARLLPYLEPRLAARRDIRSISQRLTGHLQRIDWPFGLSETEWLAVGVLGACAALALSLALAFSFGLALTIAMAAGVAPWLWLKSQADRAERELLRDCPDRLETWALNLGAGVDFATAIRRDAAGAASGGRVGLLSRHLELAALQLETGASVDSVLAELDKRLNLPALSSLFAGIRESLRSGASLAPLLQNHAELLRDRWFEDAERRAAEAAVKLMLPLMLVFAAVMVIVLGPLLLQFGLGL